MKIISRHYSFFAISLKFELRTHRQCNIYQSCNKYIIAETASYPLHPWYLSAALITQKLFFLITGHIHTVGKLLHKTNATDAALICTKIVHNVDKQNHVFILSSLQSCSVQAVPEGGALLNSCSVKSSWVSILRSLSFV